ncbi:type II toxin-antitoxin system VapC family toxin [Thiothrix nivea]|uniref:PilT protein domain protein n=1 Tax=Thiothrix nivea (strain ATCC 35100 / DSM 5205 / JP2) TaxID=870187 RepID=A0A656HG37_THINJ|nr:type II toxin-antitoxin system VapC family toxin [Thiothrix nivea]EIJ35407.1 PilT protein domain protein [Thiothrix nivea DSM 5205]
MFLLDSNIFIYAINPNYAELHTWFAGKKLAGSEVSLVETLGYHRLNDVEKQGLEGLFALTEILPVSRSIIDQAVALRQQRKMSLGDALIAATAVIHGLPLVTRNTGDFDWIEGLVLHNPLKQ